MIHFDSSLLIDLRCERTHESLDRLLGGLVVAYPDGRFASTYGRLLPFAQRCGRIGTRPSPEMTQPIVRSRRSGGGRR